MTNTPEKHDALDVRRLSSKCAFAVFIAGALATLAGVPSLDGWRVWGAVGVSVLALVSAVLTALLPFHRWPRAAMLPAVVVGCVLVGTANYL